jgi:hypothetical protein
MVSALAIQDKNYAIVPAGRYKSLDATGATVRKETRRL